MMGIVRGILAVLFASHLGFAATTDPLHDVRRILFLGDSITQSGDYVTDIECWLLARGIHIEVVNMGLGSETAAVLTKDENSGHLQRHRFARPSVAERIGQILTTAKPDMVIALYGMNDGGALPADESGDKRFADAITSLMLFSSNGAEIRRLVAQRNRLLFDAWMASVPHHRPGVAGGPGSRPGLSMEEAGKKALKMTEDIQALLP